MPVNQIASTVSSAKSHRKTLSQPDHQVLSAVQENSVSQSQQIGSIQQIKKSSKNIQQQIPPGNSIAENMKILAAIQRMRLGNLQGGLPQSSGQQITSLSTQGVQQIAHKKNKSFSHYGGGQNTTSSTQQVRHNPQSHVMSGAHYATVGSTNQQQNTFNTGQLHYVTQGGLSEGNGTTGGSNWMMANGGQQSQQQIMIMMDQHQRNNSTGAGGIVQSTSGSFHNEAIHIRDMSAEQQQIKPKQAINRIQVVENLHIQKGNQNAQQLNIQEGLSLFTKVSSLHQHISDDPLANSQFSRGASSVGPKKSKKAKSQVKSNAVNAVQLKDASQHSGRANISHSHQTSSIPATHGQPSIHYSTSSGFNQNYIPQQQQLHHYRVYSIDNMPQPFEGGPSVAANHQDFQSKQQSNSNNLIQQMSGAKIKKISQSHIQYQRGRPKSHMSMAQMGNGGQIMPQQQQHVQNSQMYLGNSQFQ
ncbi:hypothetical protein FGO68_gene1835 [Halteria grandinella]|uniref:Uncharacterized protein n=1 Tax=Halteria grandinella TaxID=5974 RepID=A0A8J8NXN3_HALGN|nr:hypothetical protein FGO68_gene1835 [Halteria grandinella]